MFDVSKFEEISREKLSKITDVFAFSDNSYDLLMKNIFDPDIPEIVNKKFGISNAPQFRKEIPTDIVRLYNSKLISLNEYIVGSPKDYSTISTIKEGKLNNYSLILSKNFYDFLFCSSTSNFTSCYSLSSDYDMMAWSGIPTLFCQPNIFITYLTDGSVSTKIIDNLGIKTPKILGRAWTYLASKNDIPYIVVGKIYGEIDLFTDFIKMSGYPFIPLNSDVFKIANNTFKFEFNEDAVLLDENMNEIHPYYDNIRRHSKEVNSGGDCGSHMCYDNGKSFYYLYNEGMSTIEASDYYEEEDEDNYTCEICGDSYYIDDLYSTYINGNYHEYVCEDCMSSYFRLNGNSDSLYSTNYHSLLNGLTVGNQDNEFIMLNEMEIYINEIAEVIDEDNDIEVERIEKQDTYEFLMKNQQKEFFVDSTLDFGFDTYEIENTIEYAVSFSAKKEMLESINRLDKIGLAFDPNVILVNNVDISIVSIVILSSDDRLYFEGNIWDTTKDLTRYKIEDPTGYFALVSFVIEINNDSTSVMKLDFGSTYESKFIVTKRLVKGSFSAQFTKGLKIVWTDNEIAKYKIKISF